MYTRAPPIDEQGYMSDIPRSYPDVIEPFMLGKDGADDVKIIWWFIAALDEGVVPGSAGGEEQFTPEFFSPAAGFRETEFPE
ncbi:uncharacterized protein N7483_012060 [Penicillium malachiteum]|uniref:uncharacterized protein n=1 Tax=Penicillium malachiteum TaxID=1324776 RepID=UPI00254676DE|nr:uncharacterized protein N7483_012060 [Penicillium malachiteum]KAJ5714879.1 hypothetical protein N7483_012060 [Penicillium malachiteum]